MNDRGKDVSDAGAATRHLIVNADDFGLSDGVNRGIIEAHENGIVTSASLMVRYPAANAAAEYARAHAELSVGLHFDISEWRFQKGEWTPAYQVIDSKDVAAIQIEFERQLILFERLMGRAPTHLDSHQHVHQKQPMRALLMTKAEALLPLRGCSGGVSFRGNFYGQTDEGAAFPSGISNSNLIELINNLDLGWSEIGCHPGYADDLDSIYLMEREEEIRVLCSAETRRAVEGARVHLSSFHDFANEKMRGANAWL
ncbi:MAG: ChbG/HpnK family deacetylase [Verrucomicrobiota bacterium]|nr:ChbG/HpnK family deacetylase [Verrucomicrobiota bacterium]